MGVSVRSALLAGIATFSAAAIAIPGSVTPPVQERTAPVALVAHVSAPPAPVAPTVLTGKDEKPVAILSAGPQGVQLVPVISEAAVAPGDVTALNAASDVINSVYAFTRYWANYAALDLAPFVLQFIPFGYLVTAQINIWYPQLLGVTDAFVYQFLDPVVNNPLNAAAWVNGLVAIGNAAVNGVINGVIGEINYFLGWLPIPPWPFAATAATQVDESQLRMLAFDESEEVADDAGSAELVPEEIVAEDLVSDDLVGNDLVSDDLVGDELVADETGLEETDSEELPADVVDEDVDTEDQTETDLTDGGDSVEDEAGEEETESPSDEESTETETETESETDTDSDKQAESNTDNSGNTNSPNSGNDGDTGADD